jgi:cytochrome c biogenesis protein CcmG/thiol:disulfide interchange protein DsbE
MAWRRVLVPALIGLPTLVLLVVFFGTEPSRDPQTLVGQPAPPFTLRTLDGETLDSKSFAGKPMVINFWSTWCVPCKQEHPGLQQAAKQHQDQVTFLGVVYQDELGAARAYLKREGTTYRHLVDPGSRVAGDYGLTGVPETFFIDAAGIVRYHQIGPISAPQLIERLAVLSVGSPNPEP